MVCHRWECHLLEWHNNEELIVRRALAWTMTCGLVVLFTGCQTYSRQPATRTAPPPAPMAPFGQPQPIPGGNLPGGPTPAGAFPTVPTDNRFPTVLPPAAAPQGSGLPNGLPNGNIQAGALQPAPDGKMDSRFSPGDAKGGFPEGKVQLYPPEADSKATKEPPILKKGPATSMPVGIRQFTGAIENIDVGLRPTSDEGLDWLQGKGYRAVLNIHVPGDSDDADRTQVEKRNMKYLSLEASPQTLSKELADEFNRLVRDMSKQPMFIYDRDGALTGGLWYVYFRTIEQQSDDVARIRAGALGLRINDEGTHREMWQAVQKLLESSR